MSLCLLCNLLPFLVVPPELFFTSLAFLLVHNDKMHVHMLLMAELQCMTWEVERSIYLFLRFRKGYSRCVCVCCCVCVCVCFSGLNMFMCDVA